MALKPVGPRILIRPTDSQKLAGRLSGGSGSSQMSGEIVDIGDRSATSDFPKGLKVGQTVLFRGDPEFDKVSDPGSREDLFLVSMFDVLAVDNPSHTDDDD